MGYEFPSTVYALRFADGRLAGLEVYVRSGSVEQVEAIAEIDEGDRRPDNEKFAATYRAFAASLVRWNLERDGQPVPATLEALRKQDVELIVLLVDAWLDAMLASRRDDNATDEDRETAAALAEFTHEPIDQLV